MRPGKQAGGGVKSVLRGRDAMICDLVGGDRCVERVSSELK